MEKKTIKIEFEGTDGAGKTTALAYFIDKTRAMGKTVLETREVGSTLIPINVKLRRLVLDIDSNLCGEAMELIFAAMRFENDRFYKTIEGKYDYVVSDRGWLSHLAYTDHNVNQKFTQDFYLNFLSEITAKPDMVLFFDVDTQVALQRRNSRGEKMDVIEAKGVEHQNRVRESFLHYIKHPINSDIKVTTIQANEDIVSVRKQIDEFIKQLTR